MYEKIDIMEAYPQDLILDTEVAEISEGSPF